MKRDTCMIVLAFGSKGLPLETSFRTLLGAAWTSPSLDGLSRGIREVEQR